MYSVNIAIDSDTFMGNPEAVGNKNYFNSIKDRLQVVVEFDTQEQKDKYLTEEYRATKKELKDLAKAWTKEERSIAHIRLYTARRRFNDVFMKKTNTEEPEKTLA